MSERRASRHRPKAEKLVELVITRHEQAFQETLSVTKIAVALEAARAEGIEEAAKEVERCGFVGPKAATEAAEAIRWLAKK